MITAITQGVKISVETFYQAEYSNPQDEEFMFAYRISIENQSDQIVQLTRRHWFIFDSIGELKEVEGEGVVGQQPVLEPGQVHQYISGCQLQSEMGKMYGYYEMQRLDDGSAFEVRIPEFVLFSGPKLN